MATRIGINGFGRIGRNFFRALAAKGSSLELVAVNDPFGDAHTMAFLLKHDSVGGTITNEVKETDGGFSVDGREIKKLESREPGEIRWGENGVDVLIESTGLFTAREKAAGHLGGSVGRVVISAPSGDADATICMGVNDEVYAQVSAEFSDKELAYLTSAVAAINTWNRFGAAFRWTPPARKPAVGAAAS